MAQQRRADTSVPADCLRDEHRDRLAAGPVYYILDAQLLELDKIATRDALWDEADAPWTEVATIAIDRTLDPVEEDKLRLTRAST